MDEKKRAPKLRFKGFTDDWEQRKLGDLVNFYGGLTYHPEDIRDNGTFIIRSSNIKDGQLVTKDNIFVNPKVVNSSYVKKGDIIVVVRNGSKSLIGKHTKLNFSLDNAVIGAFMTGIRSNNTDFINALFDSDNYKKEIQKNLGEYQFILPFQYLEILVEGVPPPTIFTKSPNVHCFQAILNPLKRKMGVLLSVNNC